MGRRKWNREKIKKYEEWFESTISKNIAAVMLLIMCLALGIVGYYSIKLADTTIKSEAYVYKARVEKWITEQDCILQMLINGVEAKDNLYKNYDEMVDYLSKMVQDYPDISAAFMGDPQLPNVLIMDSGWIPEEDYDITIREWYVNAIDKDEIIITGPYKDVKTGEYCITFSKRVVIDGKVVGVLGIDYYMNQLIKILGASYGKSEYVFLVDGEGTIIVHPSQKYCLSSGVRVNVSETPYMNDKIGKSKVILDYDYKIKCAMKIQTEGSEFMVYIVKDWIETYMVFLVSVMLYVLLIAVAFNAIDEEET